MLSAIYRLAKSAGSLSRSIGLNRFHDVLIATSFSRLPRCPTESRRSISRRSIYFSPLWRSPRSYFDTRRVAITNAFRIDGNSDDPRNLNVRTYVRRSVGRIFPATLKRRAPRIFLSSPLIARRFDARKGNTRRAMRCLIAFRSWASASASLGSVFYSKARARMLLPFCRF